MCSVGEVILRASTEWKVFRLYTSRGYEEGQLYLLGLFSGPPCYSVQTKWAIVTHNQISDAHVRSMAERISDQRSLDVETYLVCTSQVHS